MLPPLDRKPSFEARVLRANGCWQWLASFNKKGYGVFIWGKRKRTGAHRAAWLFFRGAIPEGMHVLHHCDNPGCVNPEHLFLGDNDANVADKVAKSRCAVMAGEKNPMWRNFERAARGEAAPCVRFTDAIVMQIRQAWSAGKSQLALAKRHETTQGHIYGIVHGVIWTHLPVIPRQLGVGPRPFNRPTDSQVASIRMDWRAGMKVVELARKYGFSHATIGGIVHGRTHKYSVAADGGAT